MASGIRVLFSPLFENSTGPRVVYGGSLRLGYFGSRSEVGKFEGERSAQLTFFARFLKTSDQECAPFKSFALLTGQLSRRSKELSYRFETDTSVVHTEPLAEDPLELELHYAAQFPTHQTTGDRVKRLYLPEVPAGALYLEVGVDLEVDGALESMHRQNDVLDVPLRFLQAKARVSADEQAATLVAAARSGKPFCEECAKARNERVSR